jgi:putative transposase
MLVAYKYRLYPNKEQQEYFAKCFGCVRFIYNRMLSDKIDYYKETKKKLNNAPAQYKKKFEWLKEVDSLALANAQMNLQTAYNNFFKRPEVGFPKFKSKKNNHFSYTTNNQGGNIYVTDRYIKLPKIGLVRVRKHRDFEGLIKSVTISKSPSGKYFVSVLVDQKDKEKLIPNNNQIGIDLGIKEFCITSGGKKYENPKIIRKNEKKLEKLQRQLAHKEKKSQNYYKTKKKIALCHEKITNTRKDYLHKISHEIISENQVIVSENLQIKNMVKNHHLAKSILDCGWYELTRQLSYKSDWNNCQYIKINRFYASSQTCNYCGYVNSNTKDLSVRKWTCPQCGAIHDRDINAAKNILNEGLRIKTAGTVEIV